jgi:hypothetical protein
MVDKYILQGNCKKLLLSLLVATVVMVPGVLALPAYLTPLNALYGPGLSCGICHINPAGGGPRTAYGMLFENQTNHMTDPTAALTAIGSPITTPPTTNTTASRTIENGILTAGNSTNITVVISNVTEALSLQETLPPGWILTPISNDSGIFKANTSEWVWIISTNTVLTVTYEVTVPSNAVPGIYNISGNITLNGTTIGVTGDGTIQVTGTTLVDTTPPTTVLSGVVEGGIYNGSVTITLSATDNPGGSGVKNTTFSLNGAAMAVYSGPINVTNVGQNTLAYMSTDNAGNVESVNMVNFTINGSTSTGTFGLTVTPLAATVNVGSSAAYNLTLTNNGNATDTYGIVTDKPSNATVTLAKNMVTIGQGNVAVVGMTVVSSTVGTYVVNVNVTSNNTNSSMMVTTTTSVVVPTLTIENLSSVPNSAISSSNPAKISANVTKGRYNITEVEFGIVDSNNMLGTGADTILVAEDNSSGVEGSYSQEDWPATYVTMGNIAVTDVVSVNIDDMTGFANVRGMFKSNDSSNGTDAIISFDRTTGNISGIADLNGSNLTIQDANSTFQARTTTFTNGSVMLGNMAVDAFTLYDMTGNMSINNPSITVNTVPDGNYQVYAMVSDANGDNASQLINIDTIPVASSSGGSGGSGGGTYPTFTATPVPTENVTTPATTETTTETPAPVATMEQPTAPAETTETPSSTPTATKGSPGIGIVAAIAIIGIIYAIRRRK